MKQIPKYDPYTGELNPYYEELTGQKNPYEIQQNYQPTFINLDKLIGKVFKYDSKYGVSNWVDIVEDITIKEVYNNEDNTYRLQVCVVSSKSKHNYELDHCIFLK